MASPTQNRSRPDQSFVVSARCRNLSSPDQELVDRLPTQARYGGKTEPEDANQNKKWANMAFRAACDAFSHAAILASRVTAAETDDAVKERQIAGKGLATRGGFRKNVQAEIEMRGEFDETISIGDCNSLIDHFLRWDDRDREAEATEPRNDDAEVDLS
jgi:hypothetical protein